MVSTPSLRKSFLRWYFIVSAVRKRRAAISLVLKNNVAAGRKNIGLFFILARIDVYVRDDGCIFAA